MKAVILNSTVIAVGNYSESQFDGCEFIDITETQKEEINSFKLPRYEDGVFYDDFNEEEYNRQFLPKIVSQRQLRTQLVLNDFDLNDIQTAINALTEPNKSIAQVAWDYAITFERDSPLLISLGESLGLSQTDIDNIFINASKL